MTDIVTTTINIAPVFQFIQIALMQLGLFTLVIIIVFLTHNRKNVEMIVEKYPLVSHDFIYKGLRSQNIENNQEIHEINERLDQIESKLSLQTGEVNVD